MRRQINKFPEKFDQKILQYRIAASRAVTYLRQHCHEDFEMWCVIKGKAIHVLNGKPYKIAEGSVVLLSPIDFHRVEMDPGQSIEYININFSYDLFSERLLKICPFDVMPLISDPGDTPGNIRNIEHFKSLLHEYTNPDGCSDVMIKNGIETAVINLMRGTNTKPGSKADGYDERVREAVMYIRYNFKDNIALADVAKKVYITPEYLSSCFYKSTGERFQDYLLNLRLNFASRLIKVSKLPLTEIGFEAGFNSSSYFSQAFKNKFGISPREFRKQHIKPDT